ncbi:uncharacterized protein LOC132698493 [Cylas formicarius]|uniref:uncharacterized protein LOC132698493 n=1 Tax=Cylas formicarius TaxID=197179 RepID=UPI0029588818|nr:uncharacterized protein LOC132698493 [Cylas formicarius]
MTMEAARTAVRLASCGLWREGTFNRGPYYILEGGPKDRGVMGMPSDVMIPEMTFFDKWTFLFPSIEKWREGRVGFWDGLIWYTDGSRIGDQPELERTAREWARAWVWVSTALCFRRIFSLY